MVKNKNIVLFIISILSVMSHSSYPTIVVFDVESFLIAESTTARAAELLSWKTLCVNPFAVKEDFFHSLDLCLPHRPGAPVVIRDGCVIPQIICDWLTNTQSAQEIKNFVINGLKDITKKMGKNTSFLQDIAAYLFTPDRYAGTMYVQKKGKSILKKCCAAKDRFGKPANSVWCLTNSNKETWHKLMHHKKIKEAVSYFGDRIIISGDVHLLKPDPAFFEYALNKFGAAPGERIIYIDTEINNIKVLQSLKIPNLYCIYCKDLSYSHVEKELKKLGVYSK